MDKWIDKLKGIFKNKDPKVIFNIAAGFALGIILLIAGRTYGDRKSEPLAIIPSQAVQEITEAGYEAELERRLADILSLSEGAGRVEVMIKIRLGREIVVGENTDLDISSTKEVDSAGGTRDVYTESRSLQTIIYDGKPLILKEIEPQIEGVVIIAEGGGDVRVKDSLTKAAQTVLGVEPHKVQVLKMKGEK